MIKQIIDSVVAKQLNTFPIVVNNYFDNYFSVIQEGAIFYLNSVQMPDKHKI